MKHSFGFWGLAMVVAATGLLAGCAADDGSEDGAPEEMGESSEDLTSAPKAARCNVSASEVTPFKGDCRFWLGKGGSFKIAPPKGTQFLSGYNSLSVDIVKPGVAKVTANADFDQHFDWGKVTRSKTDGACWLSTDPNQPLKVCAY